MESEVIGPYRLSSDVQKLEKPSALKRLISAVGRRSVLAPDVLESYRAYLLLIANRELEPGLRTILGASDLVQESIIEAQQSIEKFAGENEGQFLGWLRRILLNNLADAARRHGRTAEQTIYLSHLNNRESSADILPHQLEDPLSSPSHNVLAAEESRRMIEALDRLPEELRQVVVLRNFEFLTFQEIGQRLGRSAGTACRTWYRAIARLQSELGASQ